MCKQSSRPRGLNSAEVIKEMKNLLPTYKVDYLCYKYAPFCVSYDLQAGTFEELKEKSYQFPQGATETSCLQWLLDEGMQRAVKLLLERKNVLELFELHQTYTEKAKTDANALKVLLDLNKVLFDGNSESALLKLLEGIPEEPGDDD